MKFLKLTSLLVLVASIVTGCGGAVNVSIGGTVTGLASGSSVTLVNNANGDTITVPFNSADNTFTFGQSLGDGAFYNVAVSAQPEGLICSVANGTGTISSTSGDITNIQVTCVVGTGVGVSVTASVTGLANGEQVVLLLNGDSVNPLTVTGTSVTASGGTLTLAFPRQLTPTSIYSVSVGTQPIGGQNCVVQLSGQTGTIPQTGSPSPAIVVCS